MQNAHRGAELRTRSQPKLATLDERGGIEIPLHGIRRCENAGRVLDVAVRIEPVGGESHEQGHHPGSQTHEGES